MRTFMLAGLLGIFSLHSFVYAFNGEEKAFSSSMVCSPTQKVHNANFDPTLLKSFVPRVTPQTKKVNYDGTTPRVSAFSEGIAYVSMGNTSGYYIDSLGNKLFDFEKGYGSAPLFSCGVLMIHNSRTSEAIILNKKGEVIKKIPNVIKCTPFVDGVAAITAGVRGKFGMEHYNMYINTKGEPLFKDLIFRSTLEGLKTPSPLKENRSAFYDYQKKLWGYRDAKGKVVIPAVLLEAKDFSEGVALISMKDKSGIQKWGYIDSIGKFVIDLKYTKEPGSFSNGLAVVVNKEDKCFFINKRGEIVSKAYSGATDFHNGLAVIMDEQWDKFIINTNFEVVSAFNPRFSNKLSCPYPYGSSSNIVWKGNDLYVDRTLLSPMGDMLITYIDEPFEGGYAPCYLRSHNSPDNKEHIGFINRKGEFVLEFVENEF